MVSSKDVKCVLISDVPKSMDYIESSKLDPLTPKEVRATNVIVQVTSVDVMSSS